MPTSFNADGAPEPVWTADGAPMRPTADTPAAPPEGAPMAAAHRAATRIRSIEGLRGYSVRATVAVRHALYLATIAGCVALTHWAFSDNRAWRFGGLVMLYSVAFMLAVASVGTILYADARQQIYDQVRHFVFGIVTLPGTALAVFMRAVNQALDTPATDGDLFAAIMRGNGLPLVYFSLVVIPSAVFARYVFGGLRSVNRSALADEESVAVWMRQDGRQR